MARPIIARGRSLGSREWRSDLRDGGDLGPGQRATLLCQIWPGADRSGLLDRLGTAEIRYQVPGGGASERLTVDIPVRPRRLDRDDSTGWTLAMAWFGQLAAGTTNDGIGLIRLANRHRGADPDGSRARVIATMQAVANRSE
jgi:hypothetical protein